MGVSMIEHGDMMNRKTVSISSKKTDYNTKEIFYKARLWRRSGVLFCGEMNW